MTPSSEFTLCLIVKDEERFLEPCLRSLRDHASAVVVVDTGSVDRTPEIAAEYADELLFADFGADFSQARNLALQQARTPWVVFLDADERFDPEQAAKLRFHLSHAAADTLGFRVLRYNLFATGGWYSGKELKIFRNDPAIRYQRRINESVRDSIERLGGAIEELPLILNHFGHCRSRRVRDEKAHMYMELMREQLRSGPEDPLLIAYLGLILRTLGRFEEAVEHARRAVLLAPEAPRVRQFSGHVLRSVADDASARDEYQTATELDPSDGGAWNMLGVAELSLGHLVAAGYAFIKALQLDPMLVHVLINQGLLEQAGGRYDRAAALFEEAAAINPAFLHEEWAGRVECDPFRELYYETIMQYAGLGYHLGYCRLRAGQREPLAAPA